MKLVFMSPDMNLGWVLMSLNTGMLWLTPVGREEGGERREERGGRGEKGGGGREGRREGGGGEKGGTCSVSNQWNIVLHTPTDTSYL